LAHQRQIKQQSAVGDRAPCHIVTATSNGEGDLVIGGDSHRERRILGIRARNDRQRLSVDCSVPYPARN
jgi:hypothetical protein